MPHPSTTRIRFALVGILACLTLGFVLSSAQSQPGRPPGFPAPPNFPTPPGGGITGIPGGGITGIPGGGITGFPGAGIAGNPGGITGIPGRPGGITGVPGGITGIPSPPSMPGLGGGRTERVWSCSGCNRELGRGLAPPAISKCPGCGARLVGIEFGGPLGGPSRPNLPNTTPGVPTNPLPGAITPPATGGAPAEIPFASAELPSNPFPSGGSTPANPTPTPTPSGSSTTSTPNTAPSVESNTTAAPANETPSRSGRVLKIIGIVGGTILVLFVIGMLVAVTKNAGGSRPVKRTRRRVVADDDDD